MAHDTRIQDRLDALYEYDREPVPENKLAGPGNFIGLYSGEHVAGTEYVIGPLFVAHGVAAADLLLGLLVGNLLAVLSWAFICAPIAVRTRLNLYWQLRKVAGPRLTFVYNIVNAIMFCFLAGSMISVSATAVGLPFDMTMPGLNDVYPNSAGWVVVVLLVGAVVTLLVILGFELNLQAWEGISDENINKNTLLRRAWTDYFPVVSRVLGQLFLADACRPDAGRGGALVRYRTILDEKRVVVSSQ